MAKTLKIEYEKFEEDGITVLSVVDENDTDFDEVDNGCYMCCKGLENNYQPKE